MTGRIQLSICIATFGRGDFIGETLQSILPQLGTGTELIVVDGASPDCTPVVLAGWAARYPRLRYCRQETNEGVDKDFDKAVAYASGEYCWLLSDDDLLEPGAVAQVLARLQDSPDLVVVNADVRDKTLSTLIKPRQMAITQDMVFDSAADERFFAAAAAYLSFIGAVVIRRAVWLERDRASYYGSLFIHVGVIFQMPPLKRVKLIAQPLIHIRYGNALWTARGFEIWTVLWPRLIWSFQQFSESARARISQRNPAASLKTLLWYRGIGAFTDQSLVSEGLGKRHPLASLVAVLPAPLVNTLLSIYCALRGGENASLLLYDLKRAPCATALSRRLAR